MRAVLHSNSALAVGLALVMVLAGVGPLQADTFAGRAFSAFVNVPSLGAGGMYLSDTGELSPFGGWEGAGLLGANVPSVLSANVLNAATSGATGNAASSSSLSDVVVLPGNLAELAASFVMAEAQATELGSAGVTEISGLTFGGTPIAVTGAPNQTVTISDPLGLGGALATLVINEQVETWEGGAYGITVNALHLTLATGEEVILGSAKSLVNSSSDVILASAERKGDSLIRPAGLGGVLCDPDVRVIPAAAHPQGEQVCIDFVTGGGHFEPPNSTRPGRVNFGFNAGPRSIQNPDIKGHLNLIDHFSGDHLKGIDVDFYEVVSGDPEHCRRFGGPAVFNGIPGHRYVAAVCDYGEPGRNDRFQVTVTMGESVVYFADNGDGTPPPFGGELDGGNIQLHTNKNKCFTEANIRQPGARSAPVATEL